MDIKCISEMAFIVVYGLLMFMLWCGQIFFILKSTLVTTSVCFSVEKPLTSANVKFSVDWPSLPFLPLCGH